MSNYVDPKKALEIIFDQMRENHLTTPEMELKKDEIIDNLAEKLKDELELNIYDLRHPAIQKRLMGAIISETLGLKQNADDFIHSLKLKKENGLTDEPEPELNERLVAGISLLLTLQKILDESKNLPGATPRLEPGQYKLLEGFLEKHDKELDKMIPEQEKKNQMIEKFREQLELELSNLYGGEKLVGGKIRNEVSVQLASNAAAFTYQGAPNPNSLATMIRDITYEPGKPDPLAKENRAKINDMALGEIVDNVTNTITGLTSIFFNPQNVPK